MYKTSALWKKPSTSLEETFSIQERILQIYGTAALQLHFRKMF